MTPNNAIDLAIACVVLTAGTLQAAEPVDIELVQGGKHRELSDQARAHIVERLPKLFATCSINSRDDPRIFASWPLATIWEDTQAKDHLRAQFATPIEIRAGHSAAITVQQFLIGLHDPRFPGPELSRHGEQVFAYVKCSGMELIKFVCAPDVKAAMPASYGALCRHIARSEGDGWPGLPPDCWPEPRLVHSVQDLGDLWQKNTKVSTRRAGKPAAGEISPNKGYVFAVEGSRPSARVTIYAEKEHVVDIELVELFGLSEVRWVNEKLIFMRPWWGRIAATDLIFDVEREKFVYAESLTDGSLAHQQYRESCPLQGCTCIKKR